jgi:PhoPQ-activated pathogenicity-related protein
MSTDASLDPDVSAAQQAADTAKAHLERCDQLMGELASGISEHIEVRYLTAIAAAAAQLAQARATLALLDRLDEIASKIDSVSNGVYHYADYGLTVRSE